MTIALRSPRPAGPLGSADVLHPRLSRSPADRAEHPGFWRGLIDPRARRIARQLAAMPAYLRRDIGLPD